MASRRPDFDAVRSAASPRIQTLMQRRGDFDDQLEFEIEASRGHWSELESKFEPEEKRCSSDSKVAQKQQQFRILGRFRRQLGALLCLRSSQPEATQVESSRVSILARFRRRVSKLFLCWQCGVGCGIGCVVVSCGARIPSPSSHLECVELEEADSSSDEETNREIFESLRKQWGGAFFSTKWGETLELGPKIAEGGQAEIFEADTAIVVKAFKKGYSLRSLQLQWPLGMDTTSPTTFAATLLEDDRFAFVMHRYWGDLRKLIDLKILQRRGSHGPPFHERDAVAIMLQIAHGMAQLHQKNIPHRDLKAANVLVANPTDFSCVVADYECSVGVAGTGFWRAPEVLVAVRDGTLSSSTFTPEADVYSFGMTSYEILTGWVPFEELAADEFDAVVKGRRPQLPHPMNSRLTELLCRCWHSNPAERPSFLEIGAVLEMVKRSFHISSPPPDSSSNSNTCNTKT